MWAIFLFVVYILARALYDKYKETPEDKKRGAILKFAGIVAFGIVLVSAGRVYLPQTSYVQSLHESWNTISDPVKFNPRYEIKDDGYRRDFNWDEVYEATREMQSREEGKD